MAKNNINKDKVTKKSPIKTKTKSKSKRTKGKKNSSKWKKILKGTLFTFVFLGLALFVIGLGYLFAIIKSTPPLDVNAVLNLNSPTSIYDRDGNLMDTWHTEEERIILSSEEIPQTLKDAFVSIEDQRFYKHNGIDIKRIAGAFVTDVKKILNGQGGMHGGSTLTQQLLKNTVLTDEDFIVERKIKEIWLALQLEKNLTKDQILTQYLNTIPLGGTVYGVEAASMLYFGKSASDLNLIECAYLAGVTQAPTTYSAYNINNKDNPSIYINRTKTVLDKMLELNKISQDQYNEAIASLDNGALVFKPATINYTLNYEWFVNPTIAEVKKDLKEKYKYSDEEISKLLMNGGLKIYSTMDRDLHDHTQNVLDNLDPSSVGDSGENLPNSSTPKLQASATITDYKTGEVLALVGGRGTHGAQSLNRAYSDLKPLGSSIKPLTVYGPAINEQIITAGTSVDDSKDLPNSYVPDNVDKQYAGNMSVREALTYSKNTVSAHIVESLLGTETAVNYGEKLGLVFNNVSKSSISAISLGQFDNNVNDRDGGNTYLSASAFGTFGNNGVYIEPKLYTKVLDASGKVLLDAKTNATSVFSPQTAYIMYDILKEPVEYYGAQGAKWGAMPVSGKTGTTESRNDYWFSGLTPYLSGSVWIGYDTPSKMTGSSSVAASLWGKIMEKAHEGKEVTDITMPSGIVQAEVCKDSGKAPTDLCRADSRGDRVYTEYFIEGTEPKAFCENHILVKVNKNTNKLATINTPKGQIIEKIFVKKDRPSPSTTDYPYVLPVEEDELIEEDIIDEEDISIPELEDNPLNNDHNNKDDTEHNRDPDNKEDLNDEINSSI